jgi:sirohydrochlorin ferrochelatase
MNRGIPVGPTMPPTVRTALLLIAHGSREPQANDDLHHLAELLRRQARYPIVEPAYLELADPDIDAGGARCVEQGAGRVILVPYFLSAGVHVRRDLTDARDRLAAHFPVVEFRLAEPLGRHPKLVEVVAERAAEAGGLSSELE